MDEEKKLTRVVDKLEKAYAGLTKALQQDANEFMIDTVIKRFEFSFEAAWKALKTYILVKDGIDVKSPKKVFQEAFSLGYIKDLEIWDDALGLRNETAHEYNDETYGIRAYDFAKKHHLIFANLISTLK